MPARNKRANHIKAKIAPPPIFWNINGIVTKLKLKTRTGSKVTKKYDEAKTPFRRVLECQYIDDKIKVKLKRQYDILNPAELKRKISRLQDRLLKLNTLKQKVRRDDTLDEKSYGYIYT